LHPGGIEASRSIAGSIEAAGERSRASWPTSPASVKGIAGTFQATTKKFGSCAGPGLLVGQNVTDPRRNRIAIDDPAVCRIGAPEGASWPKLPRPTIRPQICPFA
jgi:hypothetical protein